MHQCYNICYMLVFAVIFSTCSVQYSVSPLPNGFKIWKWVFTVCWHKNNDHQAVPQNVAKTKWEFEFRTQLIRQKLHKQVRRGRRPGVADSPWTAPTQRVWRRRNYTIPRSTPSGGFPACLCQQTRSGRNSTESFTDFHCSSNEIWEADFVIRLIGFVKKFLVVR